MRKSYKISLFTLAVLFFIAIFSIGILEERGVFNEITGAAIAGAGLLLSRPKSASFVMIIVLLAIIAFFNRKRIKEIIEKIKEKRSEKL